MKSLKLGGQPPATKEEEEAVVTGGGGQEVHITQGANWFFTTR